MKKLLLLPILFLLCSCEEQGELTKDRFNVTPATQDASLKYHGIFVPTSGISVTGEARIYLENNQYKVQLEGFSISEGPDLKVYLSKAATPSDFVSLGNLTSATVYTIPQGINILDYSYVLIHCQEYNHLFAVSKLIQN
ncbi:DM13 domain-containing protein [Flavobacterium soyangense]|uniref:DM13 domain-containing protein n=1 Tax=Flavobacterium soyangense TaxID=2023265 RepID=A0A930UBK8_9FLAO|nr:DM13 domain-containing protein [Flavobacterium soyangense]MBF2708429.1 DM13 domain-containing protein [Flavobacterium soyangense]